MLDGERQETGGAALVVAKVYDRTSSDRCSWRLALVLTFCEDLAGNCGAGDSSDCTAQSHGHRPATRYRSHQEPGTRPERRPTLFYFLSQLRDKRAQLISKHILHHINRIMQEN